MRVCRKLYARKWRLAIVAVAAIAGSLAGPRAARADQIINVAINVPAQVLTNPCAPELVAVSGVLHIVITTTMDSSGGYSATWSDNESFSGQGLISKIAYQGSSTHETGFHATAPFPYMTTDIADTEIISQGGTWPNYILHISLHFTVTADGTPTVTADNLNMSCTG